MYVFLAEFVPYHNAPNREAWMRPTEQTAIGTISDLTKSLERIESGEEWGRESHAVRVEP